MQRIILASLCMLFVSAMDDASIEAVATINIRDLARNELETLKSNDHFSWWSELGDTLVVGGKSSSLASAGVKYLNTWPSVESTDLQVIVAGHKNERPSSTKVIAQAGRITLAIKNTILKSDEHMRVTSFAPNTSYVQSSMHSDLPPDWSLQQQAIAKSIMDEVDGVRWFGDVAHLTNWNRHVSSVDIVSARDWIKDQFDLLKPTSTALQKFTVNGRDAWNVIATLSAGDKSDIYIIGAHYDSLSEQTSRSAPGAEDNASGAAGVLEMARVFAGKKTNATLIFIAFSGEEQGLIGSKAYVRSLSSDVRSRIKGVITMDMIGYSKDDSEDVLLETATQFKDFSDRFAAASKLVPGLNYYTSFNPFGSDHMPFIDNDIPAILTIDNDWGDYPSYHRSTDTIDKVSREMGLAILRMNVATLAVMTGV